MSAGVQIGVEDVARAMRQCVINDGEGNTYRLFDLLDCSGENKAHMIVNQLAQAALAAAAPRIEAMVRERCARIAYEEADCGGPSVCRVQRLKDGSCLNSINGDCGRDNAESVAAAIREMKP